MKLLYTVIICSILQMFLIKPLQATTTSTNTSALEDEMLEFYRKELKTISENFLIKAKIMCKELLKDKKVQEAATPIFKEFKKNLTDFLYYYPMFKRYGLVNELALVFDEKFEEPLSDNPDLQYIWELIRKQGYDNLNMEYESNYEKFIKTKFIPKFKELMAPLSPPEKRQKKKLLKWFKKLEKCQDYECMMEYFAKLITQDQTPKEELQEYIEYKIGYLYMFYCYKAYDLLRGVLKDPKLNQIKTPLMQYLTIDINEFIMEFEINDNFYDLITEFEKFNINILQKYYYNTEIPFKDHELIVQIFNAHGFAKLGFNVQMKFNDFIENDLPRKVQEFKNAIIQQTLAKEQPVLKNFEKLKDINRYDERYEQFMKFYHSLYITIEQ